MKAGRELYIAHCTLYIVLAFCNVIGIYFYVLFFNEELDGIIYSEINAAEFKSLDPVIRKADDHAAILDSMTDALEKNTSIKRDIGICGHILIALDYHVLSPYLRQRKLTII